MIILAIETSCDETACAILQKREDRITILSNVVASSADLQSKYGGIIPEYAAREQIKSIIPVIKEALEKSQLNPDQLDAIAVTCGPGLIGSLLVGVETAKVLCLVWSKPLIPVNHLIGHFYANWIQIQRSDVKNQISEEKTNSLKSTATSLPSFPCLGLLVSGGHSDLVLFKNHGKYEYLGGTRDDAAGECFDKCARLLNLAYPGGPQISKFAKHGDPKAFKLPRPLHDSNDLDFSFSGLKTAVSTLISDLSKNSPLSTNNQFANLCASIEQAIIDSLLNKLTRAIQKYQIEQIIVAGGVAANNRLRDCLDQSLARSSRAEIRLYIPPPFLCTDNAAMIASAAFFTKPAPSPLAIQANPSLSLSQSD